MLFVDSNNSTEQGNIGEARAIYEYILRGYVVSKPINDKAKYDLIIDDGTKLLRVQVKTTSRRSKNATNGYCVMVASTYANRNASVITPRADNDYDVLFILTERGDAWSIPVTDLGSTRSEVLVGTKKYERFKLESKLVRD